MRQEVIREKQMQVAWQAWQGRLRRFLMGQVAEADLEDVLQETLLRIWKGVGQVREEERMDAWVYKVARSVVMDRWRREFRRRGHEEAFGREVETLHPNQAEMEQEEWLDPRALLALSVPEFIDALPETYRDILTLTELEGLTQQEAAERLGLSLSGAKSRVQRGRRLLRQRFEECCALAFDGRGRLMGCTPRSWETEDCSCEERDEVSRG